MSGVAAARRLHPLWGLAEVALLGGLFIVTLWIVGPNVAGSGAAKTVYWAAVALWAAMIGWISPFVAHRDPPSLRGWGLGRPIDDPGRVRNAWPSYLAVTATAAAALLAACWIRDRQFVAHTDWRSAALKLAIYLVYGPIQAIAFFGYVQTRLRAAFASVMPGAVQARLATAAAVAGLFALAHAPNWPLAGMTLTMGLVWSWLFWARPNVLLLGASHAVLGTITYSVLHLYTRIGPFYAHPEGHIVRAAIPGLQRLVGDLF